MDLHTRLTTEGISKEMATRIEKKVIFYIRVAFVAGAVFGFLIASVLLR